MPVIDIKSYDHFEELYNSCSKSYIIIDFYINSCGPCKEFEPVYESYSNSSLYETVLFLKVNSYIEDNIELVEKYGVKKFPTFVVLKNTGEVYNKMEGSAKVKFVLDSIVPFDEEDF